MARRRILIMNTEELADDVLLKAFELLPPVNVARKVEETMEEYGSEAAGHAWKMATFARAYGQHDVADDYDHVLKTILERQRIRR